MPASQRENAIYVAARDLAKTKNGKTQGRSFPGTHQFSILVPDNPEDFTKDELKKMGITEPMRDLGNGKRGWVIGAHNKGNLSAEFNEPSDFKATQEFFNPNKYTKWYKSDFDTEAYLVKHQGLTDTQYITNILQNTVNYQNNEKTNPIKYPSGWSTLKNNTQTINSNSWNQSVLKYSGGTKVHQDFNGFDHGNQNTIPKIYFNKKMKNKYFNIFYKAFKGIMWLFIASLCFIGIQSIQDYYEYTKKGNIFGLSIIDNEIIFFSFFFIISSMWYYKYVWNNIKNKKYKYISFIIIYPIILLLSYWIPGIITMLFIVSSGRDSL